MKTETLKELIKVEIERKEYSKLYDEIVRLINLYEKDNLIKNEEPYVHDYRTPIFNDMCGIPDEVPYGEICSCNPKNGGSGICGCIMGGKMVPNPKKYPSKTIWSTTTGTSINPNVDGNKTTTYNSDSDGK